MNLRKLFGFCEHTWKRTEILRRFNYHPTYPSNKELQQTVGYIYVCQCEKCGVIRKFKV